MGLGAALAPMLARETDPAVRRLKVNSSGCPNSCGQHWIGDIGFYGNARKIDGKEVPYYLMMLGGTQNEFGLAIQSLPARLVPTAVERVLTHFKANRQEGETFRAYVLRHKVETFRKLTADLVKPANLTRRSTRTGATKSLILCNWAAASARHKKWPLMNVNKHPINGCSFSCVSSF